MIQWWIYVTIHEVVEEVGFWISFECTVNTISWTIACGMWDESRIISTYFFLWKTERIKPLLTDVKKRICVVDFKSNYEELMLSKLF